MKFAAAYLLACLGAEQAAAAATTEEGAVPSPAAVPSKDDVRRILGSVGVEVEDHRLDLLFTLVDGKDVTDLIAAGREQLAYAPSGAAAAAAGVAGSAAPGAVANAAAAEAKEEEAKKKEEEEDEEDVGIFSLFD